MSMLANTPAAQSVKVGPPQTNWLTAPLLPHILKPPSYYIYDNFHSIEIESVLTHPTIILNEPKTSKAKIIVSQ